MTLVKMESLPPSIPSTNVNKRKKSSKGEKKSSIGSQESWKRRPVVRRKSRKGTLDNDNPTEDGVSAEIRSPSDAIIAPTTQTVSDKRASQIQSLDNSILRISSHRRTKSATTLLSQVFNFVTLQLFSEIMIFKDKENYFHHPLQIILLILLKAGLFFVVPFSGASVSRYL